MSIHHVHELEQTLDEHFTKLRAVQQAIANILATHADGKLLKGNELVGWLGEIYGKLLLGGTLVPDTEEHDFETPGGSRVSVKARKGEGRGWNQTGLIPRLEGPGCPTHLMFVQLTDGSQRVWLYPWEDLLMAGRFKPKYVRKEEKLDGAERGFVFKVSPKTDAKYLIFPMKPDSEANSAAAMV